MKKQPLSRIDVNTHLHSAAKELDQAKQVQYAQLAASSK
jgi:hypothetical protein